MGKRLRTGLSCWSRSAASPVRSHRGSDSIGPPELKVGHGELGEGAGMLLTWTQMSCKMAVNELERNWSLSTRTNLQTRQKKRQCEREKERDGKLNQQPSRVSAAIPNLALLSGPCGQCHLCGVPRQLPPDQHTHFEERTTSLLQISGFLESFWN
ncbi:hypothetical protein Q8A67_025121 [Cirrhinus molitorella]|uniref:Uncharacterized protein n=1 Tax=Cirrhinus molitorella TaxID=172907 RepID=A0AA88P000_9TELE|nr:hypothetical protein Q8A67_025121 [Cirrhinus molitorella]